MISLKPGVTLTGIRPELLVGIMVAQGIFRESGLDTILTSVTDGRHSSTSLHYSGCACDLRTRHIPNRIITKSIADAIREALGHHFDVILETDHIHMEWQPRHTD